MVFLGSTTSLADPTMGFLWNFRSARWGDKTLRFAAESNELREVRYENFHVSHEKYLVNWLLKRWLYLGKL